MENTAIDPEVEEVTEMERLERLLMGRELRRLREQQGMSVAQVSEKTYPHYTEERIIQMESGSAPMYVIPSISILNALGALPDALDPERLLGAYLIEKGYADLTEKNRTRVDSLASELLKEQKAQQAGSKT